MSPVHRWQCFLLDCLYLELLFFRLLLCFIKTYEVKAGRSINQFDFCKTPCHGFSSVLYLFPVCCHETSRYIVTGHRFHRSHLGGHVTIHRLKQSNLTLLILELRASVELFKRAFISDVLLLNLTVTCFFFFFIFFYFGSQYHCSPHNTVYF